VIIHPYVTAVITVTNHSGCAQGGLWLWLAAAQF
jgi:hypothetical protein